MKAINIGIVKAIISQKMSGDYLTEGSINDIRKPSMFLDIVKDSPLLQLEHKVFERLENKTITNDIGATRYIDNNLSLFESYSKENLEVEHSKLKRFVDDTAIDAEKANLYEAIGNLISETLDKTNPDVDLIHDSFTTVLNHIKEEKIVVEHKLVEIPKEMNGDALIETALSKFTEKYEALEEADVKLIKSIVMSDEENKQSLFESLRTENISLLKETKKEGIEDKIHETIDKINKMEYSEESSFKNIISLHQLKKDLV